MVSNGSPYSVFEEATCVSTTLADRALRRTALWGPLRVYRARRVPLELKYMQSCDLP